MNRSDFKETIKNVNKAWKYCKKEKGNLIKYIISTIILCIISAIVPAIGAKLLLNVTDGLLDSMIKVAILLFVIEITRNFVRVFSRKAFDLFSRETLIGLQCDLASETVKLKTREIDNNSSGVFIDRLGNDARSIPNVFVDISNGLAEVIANIGVLIAIFFVSKIFFVYFMITITVLYFVEKIRMKKFYERDKVFRRIREKNTGLIGELVRGIRDIKVLNIDKVFIEKTNQKLIESNEEWYKMSSINRGYNLVANNVSDFFNLMFIVLGVVLISNNYLSVPSMVVLYMYNGKVTNLLTHVTFVLEAVKEFNVSATRVFDVLGDTYEKETFGKIDIPKINGDFEFKNVSFSYKDELPVLNDISFKIKANETVSFVGKSGSGKSTIFSLLDKLYEINNGEILIDGVNINDLTKDSLRNNISIITQSPYIFNFSIKENLTLVKPNLTDEEMIEACKLACLHDFIETLPDKYDTVVGEGGITLSGGQRQRLAIARALLRKTEIILFDEATSALDNETQESINEAIKNLKGEYTILIIAHRLSTVVDSDRIILIEEGKVIDEGKHSDLMERNLFYKKLYQKELN